MGLADKQCAVRIGEQTPDWVLSRIVLMMNPVVPDGLNRGGAGGGSRKMH